MTHISDRVQALAPSATLAMSQKSNELKAQGVDVINLSVGEPDFETPLHIKEAAKRAIDENFTFYTPVPGYMSLRKAVSEKLSKENGVSYAPEQIVVSNGAKQALGNDIPHAFMGQLCGDGQACRRDNGGSPCRYHSGFQNDPCPT